MTSIDAVPDATDALPHAGIWYIDLAHSSVNFTARHLMSKVRGNFKDFDGTITIGEQPESSTVEATIRVASVDTGQSMRDDHLRTNDFFLVEEYPTATFRSTAIARDGAEWRMTGELTIRGTTRTVDLEVEHLGVVPNPMGEGLRVGFTASTQVHRDEFGLNWGLAEAGGAMVGKKVGIELDVEAVDTPPQA